LGHSSQTPTPNRSSGRAFQALRWALSLLAFGILERLFLWFTYEPQIYGDTGAYLRVASVLSNWSLDGYDGTRVPGYPAFLALAGQDPDTVWLGQMVLGLLISLMLFWIGWRMMASPPIGFLAGMAYNLSPGQVFFEANLLSETLTTFFLVSSTALLLLHNRRSDHLKQRHRAISWLAIFIAIMLGITSSMAGLTRPLFYFLPLWLLPFVWHSSGGSLRERIKVTVSFGIPVVLLLGGWLLYMRSAYHVFSPSVMIGFHLVQHSGEYFEDLPDKHAEIRDTYLRYREDLVARTGVQTNAIWDAIPEMAERSGLGFYGLARELQRLSIELILKNPLAYLHNVFEGWVGFWKAPVYWRADGFGLGALAQAWVFIGRGIAILFNLAFLVWSALVLISQKWRARLGFNIYALGVGGMIWATSFLQTLTEHGDNHRFLVPLQTLAILLVINAGWSYFRIRRRQSG
jgi:hypothetical protein